MALYASVIIDISHEKLDRAFQYRIPEELSGQIYAGVQVSVPFGNGNHIRQGFVIEVTDKAEFDERKIKAVASVVKDSIAVETQLIALAHWMRKNYGGTMNQALKTVIPVRQKIKAREKRILCLNLDEEKAREQLSVFHKKHHTARARLLEELLRHPQLSYEIVMQKLNVTAAAIRALEEKKIITVLREIDYRTPTAKLKQEESQITLNAMQRQAADAVRQNLRKGINKTYLLHGVTGSGKTEVYMELIAEVIRQGRQAIVLIPEIALTYQTVMRFYAKFGARVSIMNSRLSKGERYDQFLRAKKGEIDIMIGPRSALFTPDRKSTRLNSSHVTESRMPSSA